MTLGGKDIYQISIDEKQTVAQQMSVTYWTSTLLYYKIIVLSYSV